MYAMSMHTTVNNARVYAVWPLCSGGTTMTSSLISLVELLLPRCRGWFLCRGTGWFLYGGSASLISVCEDTQSSVFRSRKVFLWRRGLLLPRCMRPYMQRIVVAKSYTSSSIVGEVRVGGISGCALYRAG